MRTVLVFPPGWAPHSPYLALPLLAANLRAAGHTVDVWDANIDLLHYVLSAESLRRMANQLEERLARKSGKEDALSRALLLLSDGLINQIDAAKHGLSSFRCFQDPALYERCRRIVGAGLKLVSAAQDGVSLDLYRLTFPGSPIRSSAEALGVVDDARTDLFRAYYADRLAGVVSGAGLVGFSITERDQLIPALVLAREVRKQLGASVRIVLGGNYLTRLARSWQGPHPFFRDIDYAILGEGENALVGLVEAIQGYRPIEQVHNLLYWTGAHLQKNDGPPVAIEQSPFADFSGMPLDQYLSPALILPTYATRSCAWNRCNFCTIAGTSGVFRLRPAERIADEIAHQKARHATAFFTLIDETLPPGVVRNLARVLNDRALDVRWYGEARLVKSFSSEVLAQAQRAGLRLIQFGLESYNQRVLDRIGKGIDEAEVLPVLRRCLGNGIAFHLFCMVGFPGESEAEAQRTLAFADEAIRLAREEYQNPCATKGVGTFGLEKGAPIWHSPERFGITLEPPPPEHDLILESGYRVSEGLSAEQATQFLERYAGAEIYRAVVARRDLSFVNRRLSPSPPREEETFLRWACDGREDLLGLRLDQAPKLSSPRLPPYREGNRALVANLEQGAVYALDETQAELYERLLQGDGPALFAAAASRPLLARDLARLTRLGLVEAPPRFSQSEHPAQAVVKGSILPFADLDFLYLSGEDYCLYDPQREAAIRLNHSGAVLWEMMRNETRGERLLARAQALFGPVMTAERLATFVNHLSRNGALFVDVEPAT